MGSSEPRGPSSTSGQGEQRPRLTPIDGMKAGPIGRTRHHFANFVANWRFQIAVFVAACSSIKPIAFITAHVFAAFCSVCSSPTIAGAILLLPHCGGHAHCGCATLLQRNGAGMRLVRFGIHHCLHALVPRRVFEARFPASVVRGGAALGGRPPAPLHHRTAGARPVVPWAHVPAVHHTHP